MAVVVDVDGKRLDLRKKFQELFGFRRLRPGQREAVEAAISGKDTLVVMPTGSGKSLCLQLPTRALRGTTVVVSPLIALMKDQADALRERGVEVAELHSGVPADFQRQAAERLAAGLSEFVYTTPERLAKPEFLEELRRVRIDLFVVDEVHCISQWGHDFRPEYAMLGNAVTSLGRPPVLALTATATPEVIEHILSRLDIADAEIVHTGYYRPNLHLEARAVEHENERRAELLAVLRSLEGPGIVYTATVKGVEELAAWHLAQGFELGTYHGRGRARERAEAQDRFMSGETRVLLATNEFGLGIDKPDVRFVIHHHMPGSLESYYQEAGRAGRDDEPSRCVLLYQDGDKKLQRYLQARRLPSVDDMLNGHHALARLTESGGPIGLAELLAISPLRKTRMQQVLRLFHERGIVSGQGAGPFELLRPEIGLEDFQRTHDRIRDREERDPLRVQQMVEYASTRTCRWAHVLRYFENDELEGDTCGHSDRCAP
jgi:ATP-dependent DNA helicase RecQ